MKKLLAILGLLMCYYQSFTQVAAFPPSVKWQQIDTDTVRVIFTKGTEMQAQRVVSLIHQMARVQPIALGQQLRKINIVLHSNTTTSNGYVALAPFRSEFYLTPPSNLFVLGNMPWHEQLAIHEYRHVQQFTNSRNGLTKWLSILFGEMGQSAGSLVIPDWFWEGDAVYAETAFTQQGRGKMPNFYNGYNSLWQKGKDYSWMKLRNGSLKDFVPNHYHLGYLLVNYGYLKYGEDFWQKVTHDASAYRGGLISPFTKAVKKHSGRPLRTFYKEAFAFYQDSLRQDTNSVQAKRNTVTDYLFPQYIGQDSLLYLKESYDQLATFVVKTNNKEQLIKQRSISMEDWYSYRKGKIAYTAYSVRPRWSLQDYSDIVVLDVATRKERWVTQKGKYFTPDLSPSADKIVAVARVDSQQTELHILNSQTGAVLQTIKAAATSQFHNPRFADDSSIVYIEKRADGTLSIEKVSLADESKRQLLPPTKHTIGFPAVVDGQVYFTASFKGNDDIYALGLDDQQLTQLTTGTTGYYFPSVNGDTLIASHFGTQGLLLHEQSLNKQRKKITIEEKQQVYPVAFDQVENLPAAITTEMDVRKYRKSFQSFNVHSWTPIVTGAEYGFQLYSNNILNTVSSDLLYTYNRNERSHTTGANLVYGGWFPVISAGGEYTFNRHVKKENTTYVFDQYELRAGYTIPLEFTKGKTLKYVDLYSDYVLNTTRASAAVKNATDNRNSSYLSHYLGVSQFMPMARQHILPRWGYTASLEYKHRLDQKGYYTFANGQFFTPGLFRNHSLQVAASLQHTDRDNILFENAFVMSRGYNEDLFFTRMTKAAATYHFPLAYPDWGFANSFYLQRLRGLLFFDYTKATTGTGRERVFRSMGTELLLDAKLFNILPISFGVRYSYLFDQDQPGINQQSNFQFVIPVTLTGSRSNKKYNK